MASISSADFPAAQSAPIRLPALVPAMKSGLSRNVPAFAERRCAPARESRLRSGPDQESKDFHLLDDP